MNILFLCVLFLVSHYGKENIPELLPNKIMKKERILPNQEKFYLVRTDKLHPETYYKVMIHFLGFVKNKMK